MERFTRTLAIWLHGLVLGVIATTELGPLPVSPPTPPPAASVDPNFITWQLVTFHNAERARAGLPPLVHDPRLTLQVSRRFAAELAGRGVLTHQRQSGVPFNVEIAQALGQATRCSENAAQGQTSAQQAVSDWMTSPGHRANILGPYRRIGCGQVGAFWVADFSE